MGFQLTYDLVEECNAIKAAAMAAAVGKEKDEIARGVKLFDGPLATMLEWFRPMNPEIRPGSDEEDFVLWQPGADGDPNGIRCMTRRLRFLRSQTTYLTARRTWDAFAPVKELVKKNGASEDDFLNVAPVLFPWTFGVLMLLRRYDANKAPHILVGIRSKELAGRHVGAASFPGGLVRPKESIEQTARRQMREECGIELETMENGFAIGHHPNAPSTTFLCVADTESEDVANSFEWKGGRAVWASEDSVKLALDGDSSAMADAFRRAGMDWSMSISIAPDALAPAKLLLNHVYPAPVCIR